jgi:8-oxo-dGTP diphosphatase
MSFQSYVVGFIFNKERTRVALIRKDRPDFQAGKLNGIGGKIEKGEEADHCMVREAIEETGFKFDLENFEYYHQMNIGIGYLFFFKAFVSNQILNSLYCPESEVIEVHNVSSYKDEKLVDDVDRMIKMALSE